MMTEKAIINLDNVNFTYPSSVEKALSDITCSISKGAFVLITGPTGCGKSTLLKVLNGSIPHMSKGTLNGEVTIAGIDSIKSNMDTLTCEVGLIFQNPNDQIVSNSVEEEIAFGLENLGLERYIINERIQWACKRLSISNLLDRDPNNLSGGQRQRVVIASQIAMQPKILAFDEPLSSLDPQSAREVMRCIADLNSEGITVVMVEHRISFVAPYCSHILLMDKGRLMWYGKRDDAFLNKYDFFKDSGIEIPDEILICKKAGCERVTFETTMLTEFTKRIFDSALPDIHIPYPIKNAEREVSIKIENLSFCYIKGKPIFNEFSLKVFSGESVAIMGANGTGKSTLFSLISGLTKPSSGTVSVKGIECSKIPLKKRPLLLGYLIQNPDLMLFCETVYEELTFGPRIVTKNRPFNTKELHKILDILNLSSYTDRAPFTLSMGQRLRTALGAVLTLKPEIVLLDEPTIGQNEENIRRLMKILFESGFIKTILFCTHDFNIAMEYADRILILSNGQIIADGTPIEILKDPSILKDALLSVPLSAAIAHSAGFPSWMCLPHEFRRAVKLSDLGTTVLEETISKK